jgi:hypothetical protein
MRTAAYGLLVVLLVANLAVELSGRYVFADGNPATNGVPGQIPYQGRLELDGTPFNGEVRLRFDLYDGPGDSTPDWTAAYDVVVYNGTFSVLLGADGSGPLPDTIGNADAFELGLTLLQVGGVGLTPPVALSGRQSLVPVPYALHAQEAADFAVNRDLAVARNLDVVGTSRLRGAVTTDTTIAAGTSVTAGTVVTAPSADINGAATVHSLTLDGATSFISGGGASWTIRSGSNAAMTITSATDVSFNRNIAVNGGIAVGGATSTPATPLNAASVQLTDADDYTAWGTGTFVCPNNGLMRGVQPTTQTVSIDLGPVTLPFRVWVVRPVCAPGM